LPKVHRDTSEVCGEPVIEVTKLPTSIQDKVYKPESGEDYYFEEKVEEGGVTRVSVQPGNGEVEIEMSEE
jgi:hypothetical protein